MGTHSDVPATPPERLAQWVRDELAAAGLPVALPDLDPSLASGVLVYVDRWNESFHGDEPEVVVAWLVSPQLRMSAISELERGLADHPSIRQQGEVKIAMAAAVIAILSAAGFTAEDRNNDMSPFDIRVLSGPAARTPPAWLPVAER